MAVLKNLFLSVSEFIGPKGQYIPCNTWDYSNAKRRKVISKDRPASGIVCQSVNGMHNRRLVSVNQSHTGIDFFNSNTALKFRQERVKTPLEIEVCFGTAAKVPNQCQCAYSGNRNPSNLTIKRKICAKCCDCRRSEKQCNKDKGTVNQAIPMLSHVMIHRGTQQFKFKRLFYFFGGRTDGGCPLTPPSLDGGLAGVGLAGGFAHLIFSNLKVLLFCIEVAFEGRGLRLVRAAHFLICAKYICKVNLPSWRAFA